MTARNEQRRRLKGRGSGSFLMLQHDMIHHPNFSTLSRRATKLLIDIAAQYNGRNNGDLSATLRLMKKRGWRSSDQLFKAKKELVTRGFVLVTRQGGLNQCNLYAITWAGVDECEGKLDVTPNPRPINAWKEWIDADDG
jgi:hypothetical protein